jgi:hypothetical protein
VYKLAAASKRAAALLSTIPLLERLPTLPCCLLPPSLPPLPLPQVAVNWVLCKGALPIPGAKNARQIEEISGALGWRLTDAQVGLLVRMPLFLHVASIATGLHESAPVWEGCWAFLRCASELCWEEGLGFLGSLRERLVRPLVGPTGGPAYAHPSPCWLPPWRRLLSWTP